MITLLYNEEDESVKVNFDMKNGDVGCELAAMKEILDSLEAGEIPEGFSPDLECEEGE